MEWSHIAFVVLKIKDSNDAVYAHFTWSIQPGYTPPPPPTHRPVPDFVQHSLGNATKYKDPRVLWVSPVYSGNPSSFHQAYHSFNYVPKI